MPIWDKGIVELTRGALELVGLDELRVKLARGQPLVVNLGADLTSRHVGPPRCDGRA